MYAFDDILICIGVPKQLEASRMAERGLSQALFFLGGDEKPLFPKDRF